MCLFYVYAYVFLYVNFIYLFMSLRYLMNLYSYVIMVNYTTTYSRKNIRQRLFLGDIISSTVEIKFGPFLRRNLTSMTS